MPNAQFGPEITVIPHLYIYVQYSVIQCTGQCCALMALFILSRIEPPVQYAVKCTLYYTVQWSVQCTVQCTV